MHPAPTLATLPDTQASRAPLISRDGTQLCREVYGQGSAVIVIPGALSLAADYGALATVLATTHTVHVLERRGHGQSRDRADGYSIDREVDDVAALLGDTGPAFVFGHSFGGLIALEAARALPGRIRKLAVFEPGVSIGGSIPTTWIPEYRRLLAAGRPREAFITFIRALGPEQARRAPRWLMRLTLPFILRGGEWRKMLTLLPSNAREHAEVGRLDETYRSYGAISTPVLLMHGAKDGHAPGRINQALSRVIPDARVQGFAELDHFAPQRGAPEQIAEALGTFFGE